MELKAISFHSIDNVQNISIQVEEGWWSGILNGKAGMFPSNFVKELESTDDGETQDALDDTGSVLFVANS